MWMRYAQSQPRRCPGFAAAGGEGSGLDGGGHVLLNLSTDLALLEFFLLQAHFGFTDFRFGSHAPATIDSMKAAVEQDGRQRDCGSEDYGGFDEER